VAYTIWGIALGEVGRYAEACTKYAKATELDAGEWMAWVAWATALARMGKRDEAEEKWRRAAELNPRLRAVTVQSSGEP